MRKEIKDISSESPSPKRLTSAQPNFDKISDQGCKQMGLTKAGS